MKATDILLCEHALLRKMLDGVEQAVEKSENHGDIAGYARLVEVMMCDHAEVEETMLFRPLDDQLTRKGQVARFKSNHEEYFEQLQKAQTEMPAAESRHLLLLGLRTLRDHFRCEEHLLTALVEPAFTPEYLSQLGHAWLLRRGIVNPVRRSPSLQRARLTKRF